MALENEDKSESTKEGASEEKQRPLIEDLMPAADSSSRSGAPSAEQNDLSKNDTDSARAKRGFGDILGDVLYPKEPKVLNPQGKMSELEMSGASREIADRVARGDKLGDSWGDINKSMQRAAESGQLEEMVQRINDQLRAQGSDKVLSVTMQNGQSMMLPEHSPFESWTEYKVSMTDKTGKEVDSTSFSANHKSHPGTGLGGGFPPFRLPRFSRPTGLPDLDIRMD
ncbi:MAG: hypothetical protein K2X77_19980 [Candidatus Obscuribacterales bacterium]|nr:hypothetical protein [Candidatus Obscuribacterales bacterium]